MAVKKTAKKKTTSKSKTSNTSVDLSKLSGVADLFRNRAKIDEAKKEVCDFIREKANDLLDEDYKVIFLYDAHNSISEHTADRIYNSLNTTDIDKVLLVIHSGGGRIEPAYLISKCCRDCSKEFHVCVPRKAKSAATLISLGAHKIHMGMMSELGPIDPQIGGLPALGLNNALKSITEFTKDTPESSDMLAKYLQNQLPIQMLGYYERVSESATQYAERLLKGVKDANKISRKLVYDYKDHSFVIDKEEAGEILGDKVVSDTPEYTFGKLIHSVFDNISLVMEVIHNERFTFVGSDTDDMIFLSNPKSDE